MIIKTINLGLTENIKKEVASIKSLKTSAKVYVREDVFKKEDIASFYTAGDCFILPTHGEAWGLPLFEALACGVPVITTDYGAPAETLRDSKGQPYDGVQFIKYQKTLSDTPYVYLQGNYWAEPSIPDMMKQMRYAFEHKDELKAGAMKTSELIRQKFDWGEVAKPIVQRLQDIYKNKL